MRPLTTEKTAELNKIALAAQKIIQGIDESNIEQSIDAILRLLPQLQHRLVARNRRRQLRGMGNFPSIHQT